MWELDCEESWEPKNWYFRTVVLEKTLESPLDCKELQPVHSKGDQPWVYFGRMMLKLKLQYFGHLMQRVDSLEKTDAWRDWGQEGKGTTEDEMAGWHPWLDGRECEWTPGVGDGQGGLACCDSWGRKESDMTEWLNWTELNWITERWLKKKNKSLDSHFFSWVIWKCCFILTSFCLLSRCLMSTWFSFLCNWLLPFQSSGNYFFIIKVYCFLL